MTLRNEIKPYLEMDQSFPLQLNEAHQDHPLTESGNNKQNYIISFKRNQHLVYRPALAITVYCAHSTRS